MKKFLTMTICVLSIIFLAACTNKTNNYAVNDKINLTGTVSSKEIIENGIKKKINILNLEKSINIDGQLTSKFYIDFDQNLKENEKVSITGTLKEQVAPDINLSYGISVSDIDNESLINTFSNDDFSLTIPSDLIKLCFVEEIDHGYIIYSINNLSVGGEVFKVISVSNDEFKNMVDENTLNFEKISSDLTKTVIIIYPNNAMYTEEYQHEYARIGDSLNKIKENIRLN